MEQVPQLSNYRPSQIKYLKEKLRQTNDLAKVMAPPLPLVRLKKYLATQEPVKFLVVRHPFDRLLSAYRDKFEVNSCLIRRDASSFHEKGAGCA